MADRKYNYVFFDLDGTIINTGEGVMTSVKYSLEKLGVDIPDYEDFRRFVGPPLLVSYKEFYGMDEEKAREAVRLYREFYSEKGLLMGHPYEGVMDTFKKIKDMGIKLAVATSKPEAYSVEIAKHFGFYEYFDAICGATFDGTRDNKADVINYAFDTLEISGDNHSDVLMVGDRKFDIIGAKTFGMTSVGVLYGYGSKEEFEEAGADFIVEKATDVLDILV